MVENLNILPVFENSFFNSRCFLQYSNRFVPPNEWKQVILLNYNFFLYFATSHFTTGVYEVCGE